MVNLMTAQQAKAMADRLRKIAHEVAQTAIGSSRVAMYRLLADQIIDEADAIEASLR